MSELAEVAWTSGICDFFDDDKRCSSENKKPSKWDINLISVYQIDELDGTERDLDNGMHIEHTNKIAWIGNGMGFTNDVQCVSNAIHWCPDTRSHTERSVCSAMRIVVCCCTFRMPNYYQLLRTSYFHLRSHRQWANSMNSPASGCFLLFFFCSIFLLKWQCQLHTHFSFKKQFIPDCPDRDNFGQWTC